MSANRSVQAAQRRRAGPTNNDPGIPGRGPQPSINSAQMFANQSRPGTGPSIPNGRLAGQQAAMQQKQMQQQSYQQGQEQKIDKLSSVSKMTIAQAITLITLRLGVVESKLINMPEGGQSININSESGVDSGLLQSVMSRLESLEKRSSSTAGPSTPELNLLKQQFETLKQTLVQTKGTTTNIVKENVALKTQVENLRKELSETKELVAVLQNLTMDNSQKILDLSMNTNFEYNADYNVDLTEANIDNLTTLQDNVDGLEIMDSTDLNNLEDSDSNEIVGTDLKQLIESELNTGM